MKNNFIAKIIGATLAFAMMIGVGVTVANNKQAKPTYAVASGAITDYEDIVAGDYYIGATTSSTDYYLSVNHASLSSSVAGTAVNNTASASVFTFANVGTNQWTIKFKDNAYYLGLNSSKDNGKVQVLEEAQTFTASAKGDYIKLCQSGKSCLSKNSNGTQFGNYQDTQPGVWLLSAAVPVSTITLSGTGVSENAIAIGSSSLTAHTINVALNPNNSSDQKVNIKHQSGSELFTIGGNRDISGGKQIDCSNGSGSFTITGTGATSGSETFRVSANTETSVYVDLVVNALNDSVVYHTVSFDSDGAIGGPANILIEDGQTFIFPSPGTKEHYYFLGWTSDADNFFDEGDESPVVTADIEYYAFWEEIAKHTVTYETRAYGLGSYSVEAYEGDYELPQFSSLADISAYTGYRFKNYEYQGNSKNPGETINLNSNTTIEVVFEKIPGDTLTAALIGRTGYGTWDNTISGTSSSAIYTGYSTTSDNNSIQLKSKDSVSGIVSTVSGGKLKKVVVSWDTVKGGTQARTLDIYGKNTAYSAASDLYDNSTKGTKIGSISYTNTTTYTTELVISNDYAYVGVRSYEGALYLNDISFEWTTFRETIETLDTETQLSYRYTKDGNNYDYSDISMRFGGCINKDLWTSLDTDSHVISGFGVMIASTNVIHSPYTIKDKANSAVAASENNDYANTLVNFYMPKASMATPAEDGDDYYWNLFFRVDFDEISINKYYVAAAYIKIDSEYVFMKEVKYSVTSLAQDYLDHRNCDGNTAEGSLAKLANLSPAE